MNPLLGLMFKINPKPVTYTWKEPGCREIHSWFVWKPFKAIWSCKGVVIEERIIQPFKFWIAPEQEFDKLEEIPL